MCKLLFLPIRFFFSIFFSILKRIKLFFLPWLKTNGIARRKFDPKQFYGKFIDLSKGKIRYYLKGDIESKLVVLVPGFSVPFDSIFVQSGLMDALVNAGYLVLTYDYYGRGFAVTPNCKYDENLYVEQLRELLEKLAMLDRPKFIVCNSMGGIVATRFVAKYPEKVEKIAYVASAGFNNQPKSKIEEFIIGLPQIITNPIYYFFMKRVVIKKPSTLGENNKKYLEFCFKYNPGYPRALASTLKNFMYKRKSFINCIKKIKVPCLCLWGEKDSIVPASCSSDYSKYLYKSSSIILEDRDHTSIQSCNDTKRYIIEFFGKK